MYEKKVLPEWSNTGLVMHLIAITVLALETLFILLLNAPINIYGHVGMVPPFVWDLYPTMNS